MQVSRILRKGDRPSQRDRASAGAVAAGARRATGAVLETLAERIARGEVDDLIARLDPALHAPLKRGRERSGGVARSMPLERFVALRLVLFWGGIRATTTGHGAWRMMSRDVLPRRTSPSLPRPSMPTTIASESFSSATRRIVSAIVTSTSSARGPRPRSPPRAPAPRPGRPSAARPHRAGGRSPARYGCPAARAAGRASPSAAP
jgi:uncharacterized protein (DUF2267 family)